MFKLFDIVKDIEKIIPQITLEAQKTKRIVEVNGKPLDKLRTHKTAH